MLWDINNYKESLCLLLMFKLLFISILHCLCVVAYMLLPCIVVISAHLELALKVNWEPERDGGLKDLAEIAF